MRGTLRRRSAAARTFPNEAFPAPSTLRPRTARVKGHQQILSAVVALAAGLLAACGGGGGEEPPRSTATTTLLAAGDIAECGDDGDEQTAALLAEYPDAAIATLGDNAYQHGTFEEFEECYGPSWGRFVERTHPATGNHDHATEDARGYY